MVAITELVHREEPGDLAERSGIKLVNFCDLLPENIEEQARSLVTRKGERIDIPNVGPRMLDPKNIKSRTSIRVFGKDIFMEWPWAERRYRSEDPYRGFLGIARRVLDNPDLYALDDPDYASVLNTFVDPSDMFNWHTDDTDASLFVPLTTVSHGQGGGLMIANSIYFPGSQQEKNTHYTLIPAITGQGAVFDGRVRPHFGQPLIHGAPMRIGWAMSFKGPNYNTANRPPGFNEKRHRDK